MSKNYDRIQSLFLGALNIAADERDAWLIEQCENQPDVLTEVRALLAHANPSVDPLEQGLNPDIGPMADVRKALITPGSQDFDSREIQRDSPNTGGVSGDRNLLFGILALQSGLISEQQLVAAMKEWTFRKNVPLSGILQQQEVMTESVCRRLDQMVDLHIGLHNNDVAQSINSLSGIFGVAVALSEMGDPEVQASVANLRANPIHDPRLESTFIGNSTSSGMRFRVLRPHAKGGLGEVFVAHDAELNRDVALKEIQQQHAGNSDTRSRFRMEAEITGALEHPGIVPVYGLGAYEDGRPFYAMRFIRGDSLKEAIRRFYGTNLTETEHNLGFRDLLNRFVDVCQAVEYAHSRGVLHRDLKPGNIMLGRFGETLVVDWGLSRATGRAESAIPDSSMGPIQPQSGSDVAMTQDGSVIGTVQYMSPEQAAGRLDQLGPATDVYSLGAILYELLTGQPPIEWQKSADGQPDIGATLKLVRAGIIQTPESIRSDIAKPLQAVCLKALSLRPQERYASVAELAEDIGRWLADEPVNAWPEPFAIRARRWMRGHQTLVASTAVSVVLAMAGITTVAAVVTHKNTELATANSLLDDRKKDIERAHLDLTERNRELRDSNTALVAAEQLARQEAAVAKAVNEFMNRDLFDQTSPWTQPNPNISLRSAIANGAESIDVKFSDLPVVAAALHHTVGRINFTLSDYPSAIHHLTKAIELRRKDSGADDTDTLDSSSWLGYALALNGQLDEADALLVPTLKDQRRLLSVGAEDTLSSMHALVLLRKLQGRYAEAEQLCRELLEQRLHIYGASSRETVVTFVELSDLHRFQGRIEEAMTVLDGILSHSGSGQEYDDDPLMITIQNHRAVCLIEQGKYKEAEAVNRKCMENARRIMGEESALELAATSSLAVCLNSLHRSKEAEELLRRTLDAQRRRLGDCNPDTLATQCNLATACTDLLKYAEAEALYRDALSKTQEVMGIKHPEALKIQGMLARACQDVNEKERLYIDTSANMRRVMGVDHPMTITALTNHAIFFNRHGRNDEAESLLREALSAARTVLGEEHPDTATIRGGLTSVLIDQRRFEMAEALATATLKSQRQTLGESHPNTLFSQQRLAQIHRHLGKLALARQLHEQTRDALLTIFDQNHPHVLRSNGELALIYQAEEDFDKAEATFLSTIDGFTQSLGEEDRETHAIRNNLAIMYRFRGRHEESVKLFSGTLEARIRSLGAEHKDTLIIRGELAHSLKFLKRFEEAESHYRIAYETSRTHYGDTNPETLTHQLNLAEIQRELGRIDAAIDIIEANLELRRELANESNEEDLLVEEYLAGLYFSQKRYDDAIHVYEGLIKKRRAAGVKDGDATILPMQRLYKIYATIGNVEKAEEMASRSVEAARVAFGENDMRTIACHHNLASLLNGQNRYLDARPHWQAAADYFQHLSPTHPRAAQMLRILGYGENQLKNYPEAEKFYKRALRIEQENAPDSWDVFYTMTRIGVACLEQQKLDDAEKWLLDGFAGLESHPQRTDAPEKIEAILETVQSLVTLYRIRDSVEQLDKWEKKLRDLQGGDDSDQ